MKQLLLLLPVCLSGMSLLAQPPLEYGARLTGKHTIALAVRYDGDLNFGVNYNLRSFNGPPVPSFPRPIDYNVDLSIGANTFSGNLDFSLSAGAHQIYGDRRVNFGIGAGLYGQWEYAQATDGSNTHDVKLKVSLAPGLHWNRISLAPAFATDLVGVYGNTDAEGEKDSEIRFLSDNGIGIRGDFIFGNVNPTVGFAFNSYYQFDEEDEEEDPLDRPFPIRLQGGVNVAF